MSAASPFHRSKHGIRAAIRVTPRSSRDTIAGIVADAGRGAAVKVAVSAPAENGKANAALLKLLAREWGVARSSLAIISGDSGRRKVVEIASEPDTVLPQLAAWLAGITGGP